MRRAGQFVAADLGDDFGCVVRSDGAVFCWGSFANGRLGTAATANVTALTSAIEVTGFAGNAGTAATTVSTGANHACALRDDGDVFCWGLNDGAQIGLTANSPTHDATPNPISLSASALDVAAGFSHSCALLVGGTVQCWGSDAQGQLGDSASGTTSATPVTVALASGGGTLGNVVQITAGDNHTCALTASGEVYCWGQIVVSSFIATAERATAVTGWQATPTQLSAGSDNTCARLVDGTVACVGANGSGRSGADPNVVSVVTAPALVTGIPSTELVTQVGCGVLHACAYTVSGKTYCWGANSSGELGRSSTTPTADHGAVTVKISGSTDYVYGLAVMGGYQFTCLTNAHGMSCVGNGASGRMGNGSTSSQSNPVVSYLPDSYYLVGTPPFQYYQSRGRFHHAGAEIEGGSCHFCALADGQDLSFNHVQGVQCWGHNNSGQLGDNSSTNRDTPVFVSGLDASTTAIAAGGDTTCSLQRGGTVKCWGSNANRLVIDNGLGPFDEPEDRADLANVTALTVGVAHACALLANGQVQCWGGNSMGQLGTNSSNTGNFGTPQTVLNYNGSSYSPLTGVVEISAGQNHTCARLATGRVRCWGNDSDMQSSGGGMGTPVLAPTTDTVYYVTPSTQTITTAISISAGENHSCSVFTNGQVWCWGGNAYREFGYNSASPLQTYQAQQAQGITDAVAVSGAFRTVCALRADGTAQCWGANATGTVGNAGTATTVNIPTDVRDTTGNSSTRLPSVVRIVSDCESTCAMRSDGTVMCWGGNAYGQLGDNTSTAHYFPQSAIITL
jgi:alpha-tubulin suppressor-like RCC1 family protein